MILFRLLFSEKQQSFGGASISCKFCHLEKGRTGLTDRAHGQQAHIRYSEIQQFLIEEFLMRPLCVPSDRLLRRSQTTQSRSITPGGQASAQTWEITPLLRPLAPRRPLTGFRDR